MSSVAKAEPLESGVFTETAGWLCSSLWCGVVCLLAEWGLLHERGHALKMVEGLIIVPERKHEGQEFTLEGCMATVMYDV